MTKLTDAQTKAVVAYLRTTAENTAKLGQTTGTIAAALADALEMGRDFTEIKADLAMRALFEAVSGQKDLAGLATGYVAALNMIAAILEAKEPEQTEDQRKQEFLKHYYD